MRIIRFLKSSSWRDVFLSKSQIVDICLLVRLESQTQYSTTKHIETSKDVVCTREKPPQVRDLSLWRCVV